MVHSAGVRTKGDAIMVKLIKERTFSEKAMTALVLLVAMVAVASAYGGAVFGSTTETVASTTLTERTTLPAATFTVTSTFTTIAMSTVSTLQIVTQTGPQQVQISGSASTKGVGGQGASPTKIVFTSASNNATSFNAAVTNGQYAIRINNHDFYNIAIVYSTAIANIGAGQCSAGAVAIYLIQDSASGWNFSC